MCRDKGLLQQLLRSNRRCRWTTPDRQTNEIFYYAICLMLQRKSSKDLPNVRCNWWVSWSWLGRGLIVRVRSVQKRLSSPESLDRQRWSSGSRTGAELTGQCYWRRSALTIKGFWSMIRRFKVLVSGKKKAAKNELQIQGTFYSALTEPMHQSFFEQAYLSCFSKPKKYHCSLFPAHFFHGLYWKLLVKVTDLWDSRKL